MLLSTTPEFSIMDYMLSISGTLILLMLGGMSYVVKQFASSVKDLKSVVQELKIMFSVEQERVRKNAEDMKVLTDRVNLIATKLELLDKDVAVLKVKQDQNEK